MRPSVFAAALLLFFVAACSEDSGDDSAPGGVYADALRQAAGAGIRPAIEARLEADSFLRSGRPEAARESLVRSFTKASEALDAGQDEAGRLALLNFLSNTAVEIGRLGGTPHLEDAIYFANLVLTDNLDFAAPWINKATAYWTAGMLDEAAQSFRMLYEGLDPAIRDQIIPNLISVQYGLARRALVEDRIGAKAEAMQHLTQAARLGAGQTGNPLVTELRDQILKDFESKANRVQTDPLELAKVHANYGFAQPSGASALREAEEKLGRSLEVRWVEARYIEELHGSDPSVASQTRSESLENAVRHYRRLIARGERGPFAVAGLCRVLRMLGRGEKALREFENSPNLNGELRSILTLLRLDEIEKSGGEDPERVKSGFLKIESLLSKGVAWEPLSRLLVKVALVALNVEDPERVAWVIAKLESRDPADPRVPVLSGELRSLKERLKD